MTGVLKKESSDPDAHSEEHQGVTEAGIGLQQPEAKEHPGLPPEAR